MSLISLRQLLDHAAENNYGVPAFNVNNLEAIRAIMEGAKELNSPVILQASGAARKYAGPVFVKKLVEAAMDEFSDIPTVLHQDHGGSPSDCKNCIELGFTSVMMDGSLMDDQKTPSDFDYNVRVTKETTDMAHALGVSVEGEIGCLGSLETGTGEKEDGVGAEGKLDHDQLLTDPDEASEIFEDFVSNLGQTNINLIKQLDEQTLREASKFSKAMNISADEVGQLVSARFAETGETSSDILTEITNQAMAVGEAAGVPFKEMAEGIKEVKLDMDTFTDMTVDGAARMTASLKQLGLSLGSFKGMMTPFRDFDTAATKMGDMSAMFGVQMDAMEMMYLANEDEEQFLHRMREQLLDQGLDVESMSKTRQRALADQLGMGVKEMKMFMSTGQMVTDQADLDAASQEASTKTQADAINALNDNMKVLARTTDEITQLITLMQEAFSAPGISSAMQNMGEAQSVITKTAASTENISGKVIGIQGAIADGMSSASEGLKNLAQQLIPAADEGLTSAIEFIDSKLSTGLVANQEVFGGPKERLEQFGKDVAPKSWPEWLHGLRDAIKYPSSPEAQAEIQEAFSQMFSSISDAFGESATLEFDGMFEQQLADLTASVTTEADIMVQNINEALYNIEASDMEANISVNVDTENIASETAAMVSEINSMLSDIESPVIKAEFQPVIDSPTATLAEDVSKSIEDATRQIVERFEKEPTTVEVNIDMDQIKNDIVNVIKEGLEKGFDNKATTFRLDIEGNKLADIIAHRITTSKGERFKLVT